ncbi:Ubiquitin carboxyl-terminal hydrolase 15 [Acorus calamus]|uniref:ubiquitinyl hydrolase 1 n=1 Tax=Acorus calamus TaxID=4465 RepID=A0AAV9F910_ACOCL|nr:Ubiquitin carboxyl-terminal hydrolase 15 [Acorus calamus]
MLEPREADLPALLLVLVVLPLVTYILLGILNEASKKKERVSMLAQMAAEETFRAETTTTTRVISLVPPSKTGIYECARCFAPATTRCSRCKSVRYCSGKCQIIHWRQGHKKECEDTDTTSPNLSANLVSTESAYRRVLLDEKTNSLLGHDTYNRAHNLDVSSDPTNLFTGITNSPVGKSSQILPSERKFSNKPKRETSTIDDVASHSYEETDSITTSNSISNLGIDINNPTIFVQGKGNPTCSKQETHNLPDHNRSFSKLDSSSGVSHSSHSGKNGARLEAEFPLERNDVLLGESSFSSETSEFSSSIEKKSIKGSTKLVKPPYTIDPSISAYQRPALKASRNYPGQEKRTYAKNESSIPQTSACTGLPMQGDSELQNMGDKKMAGLKKVPKIPKRNVVGSSDGPKKKTLFPYEDLVNFFQCEVWDFSPRGLVNCGNSCYANAVLQCLMCTKPLSIYLLRRLHSRTCGVRGWCLMCELEQHVSMLLEGGGPLSPSRLLSNMRNIGCRMGGGNQEDAHEFLRLLLMSMQSIFLESLGGEKQVDSRLQETTLIQQIFGGRLRSKVKCLRCHHESERYENIMDLTLEILDWVETLEDALAQFTAAEDLDGENMYRCGRCATYVKARKQLSVHEAPNILTIVLKRFQSGKYGKINKCVSFPDMLDMIPFMTGSGDSPPLYMLYAVVVHLDTLNESFSGHYVSYLKDLRGTWFKIDDTEVQPVPMSQVMSEGAYILFYSRSFPRPPRIYNEKMVPSQAPMKHCSFKVQKTSNYGPSKSQITSSMAEIPSKEYGRDWESRGQFLRTGRGQYSDSGRMDFSDSTSSDRSLFTSSDDASFTTESTRDSFSTVDCAYTTNFDSISSIFSS